MIMLGVACIIFVLDQIFKFMAVNYLSYGMSKVIIPHFFNLTLVFNRGAAFGILQGQQILLFILSIICLVVLATIYKLYAKNNKAIAILLGLILGGALGNAVDRIRFGYVVDFLDFYLNQYHWPAFNLADSAISIGTVLFGFWVIFIKDKEIPNNIQKEGSN